MATAEKLVRQSVSLPARLARRVRTLAEKSRTSTNRVLVDLIETGIESKEAEKSKFFDLADQLSATSDPVERMPKIQWTELPPALRDHFFERLAERKITLEDLYQLKLWRESEPDAPEVRGIRISDRSKSAAKVNIRRHSCFVDKLREVRSCEPGRQWL